MRFMRREGKQNRKPVTVSLDKELLKDLDEYRGDTKRSTIVERAVRAYLLGEQWGKETS